MDSMLEYVVILLSSTATTALVTGRIDYGQAALLKHFWSRKKMHVMLLLNRGYNYDEICRFF